LVARNTPPNAAIAKIRIEIFNISVSSSFFTERIPLYCKLKYFRNINMSKLGITVHHKS